MRRFFLPCLNLLLLGALLGVPATGPAQTRRTLSSARGVAVSTDYPRKLNFYFARCDPILCMIISA